MIAAFTAALAAGASTEEAAQLANYAGGIVVMKRGTATVSRDELLRAIEQAPPETRRTRGHQKSSTTRGTEDDGVMPSLLSYERRKDL